MSSVLEFLREAKENKGKVPFDIKLNYTNKIEKELNFYFEHHISQNAHFIAPLSYSRNLSDKMTPSQKAFVDKILIKERGGKLSLDVYALLNIPEEQRQPESFDPFIDFYEKVHALALKHFTDLNIKLCYETGPMRLEPFVGFRVRGESRVEEDENLTKEFEQFIKDQPLVNNWFKFIAKHLKNIGRWSWVNIGHEGVLTFEEEHKLYNEFLEKREAERAKNPKEENINTTEKKQYRVLDLGDEDEIEFPL